MSVILRHKNVLDMPIRYYVQSTDCFVSKASVSIELVGSWPPEGTILASLLVAFILFAIQHL